ncbi:MAG TPA: branched-chain amino acid transaminase [Leptospiraceae bacterium]|nr:branched-chain amino acid transaminase [Leptospiraceae bacterium]HMX30848.1 branched-chain amino acid transaminase [Leptospiraceae bacterium]HMY30079.1 branched-chain amino acid transaminase [Leptospiraceae bacterium]HMZ62734.1 branched-chain amino acid transaminase [Leptospiraceae bacterium]HNA07260.1 branched-chain amino acid transaminase [Leptospiraceae bacterium]
MGNYKNLSYFEGKIVPSEKALVSIQTHALQYGTSVFGGIRGYYNSDTDNVYIFRLKDHIKRLLNSAKLVQLQFTIDPAELEKIIIQLVKECGYKENIYLRPFIYTSALQLSPRFHDVKAELAIYILPLNDYLDTKSGLKTMVSSWRRIDDTIIPTMSKAAGGYVNSALAKSEAVQNGCDEAIFLDSRGFVSEGSAENIFIIRDGRLITPSLTSSILEGITRRSVIDLARKLGIEVIERDVTRSELYVCDEAFFSGTGVQVAWIKEIDRRAIGNGSIGPITKKLQDLFFEMVTAKNSSYKEWLTAVY